MVNYSPHSREVFAAAVQLSETRTGAFGSVEGGLPAQGEAQCVGMERVDVSCEVR